MKKYSVAEYIRRYLILVIGLFIMAFGVALSTKAELGTSPVSCVPYVLSCALPYTMGTLTVAMHIVFIVIQILLLRKDYEPVQLLQLLVAFVFGYFTDFALQLTSGINAQNYIMQWVLCLLSCILIAFGVTLEVRAGVVMLAGEGTMTAISKVFHIEFGKVKIGFDVFQVATGLLLSFVLLHGLQGIREGTIAAAILVGTIVRILNRRCSGVYRLLGLEDTAEKTAGTLQEKPLIITIAREFGSGGHEVGQMLADSMNIPLYDRNMIAGIAERSGMRPETIEEREQKLSSRFLHSLYMQNYEFAPGEKEEQQRILDAEKAVIGQIADQQSCIMIGRLGCFFLRGRKNCLNVFLYGDEKSRVLHYQEESGETPEKADRMVRKQDLERRNHFRYFTGRNMHDVSNYDLCINTSEYDLKKAVQLIRTAAENCG